MLFLVLMLPRSLLLISTLLLSGMGYAQESGRVLWQPVLEYMVRAQMLEVGPTNANEEEAFRINPFLAYTHLGTDFGFHGPGENHLRWQSRKICAVMRGPDEWAGMWHSLAGQASQLSEQLHFGQCYSELISADFQPRISAIQVRASGLGKLKIEIKTADGGLAWSRTLEVQDADARPIEKRIEEPLGQMKFLNWTAEPGADVCLTALRLAVRVPQMDFERYVLLASYAKLARCYAAESGLVKDRAHLPSGAFDSVPASGYFALATAAVAQREVGFVSQDKAKQIVQKITATLLALPRAHGLLPHFTRTSNGQTRIHPGTEYSSVDTSLAYHSLLFAAHLVGDAETGAKVLGAIREIDFQHLADGAVHHGYRDDGETLIPSKWTDWGGETALVMLMQKLAGSDPDPKAMQTTGRVWQGSGFIAELQSMFYPHFDATTPDAITGVDWFATRRDLFAAQKRYFLTQQPKSRAASLGIFGLSAGEGIFGSSYEVCGSDLTDQRMIHPHYVLMAGVLEDDPQVAYRTLQRLENAGYFTPWGMVETIASDGSRYLPMIGSLNASFETLGAYHLLAKSKGFQDAIHNAARTLPETRAAIQLFYPETPSQ
jgi:hypothetical protein